MDEKQSAWWRGISLNLFQIFFEQKKFENALVIANKYVEFFPKEYQGYSLQNKVYEVLKQEENLPNYAELEEEYEHSTLFWEDWISYLGKKSSALEMEEFLLQHQNCRKYAPEIYYKTRFQDLVELERFEEFHNLTREYSKKLIENDQRVIDLIEAFDDGDYVRAGNLANRILKEEVEKDSEIFRVALLFQIQIILILTDNHPTGKQLEVLRKMVLLREISNRSKG